MSWIQALHETYERCQGREPEGAPPLLPTSHSYQQANVEITLDADGNFRAARTIGKNETIIPATEASAGRTGKKPPPHPLCDKIQYCAGDYSAHGGTKPSFFSEYESLLASWCESDHAHPKARAVLTYIRKGHLVSDLIREQVLVATPEGELLTHWESDDPTPEILKVLTPEAQTKARDQGGVFIRWRVEQPGVGATSTWEDTSLQRAWSKFEASRQELKGLCMATGQPDVSLALSHPKRIRHPGDGAKLISANDASGFTFRGRFTDCNGNQACSVGIEVTQKAHSALRWLIQRQGFRNGDQVIVCWATSAVEIPDPLGNTFALLDESQSTASEDNSTRAGETRQAFAMRLNRKISGYRAALGSSTQVILMALDAATPGRMAVTCYRELSGSDFLDRIETWHRRYAWPQTYGKDTRFVGTPSPLDIGEAAFGRRMDQKLRKQVVERLLPCIIEGQAIPRDLITNSVHRACSRAGTKWWEWEKALGIACGLFRGANYNEEYGMTLETSRTGRDYLYGRLLAIAEHLELRALYVAGEKRETNAAKLMQRFADRPLSTWRTLELSLPPYKMRLRSHRPGFLHSMESLLDEVIASFPGDSFLDDSRLSGEFLLGYHCQRRDLNNFPGNQDSTAGQSSDNIEVGSEA